MQEDSDGIVRGLSEFDAHPKRRRDAGNRISRQQWSSTSCEFTICLLAVDTVYGAFAC
jgi:hypothetical protein